MSPSECGLRSRRNLPTMPTPRSHERLTSSTRECLKLSPTCTILGRTRTGAP
ncbi:hypothetical protein [Lysobacter gummosus]|uniref:hypothetical protein n=1 Tax=Lysobacter gummosus TaxID=262324 RepID=UPI00363A0EA9